MSEVKSVWNGANVSLAFRRPLFGDWSSIPTHFFTMIYDALAEVVPITSKEFTLLGANQLSEVRAKYAIFGGTSSVTISPDALVFDFPGLFPKDTPLVQQILSRIHDALPVSFPDLRYEQIDVQSFEHLEFIREQDNPTDYLAKFRFPTATPELGGDLVLYEPVGKCEIMAQDGRWKCTLNVERSQSNARAVFVATTFSLYKVEQSSPYQEKLERVRNIIRNGHRLLELELV